MGLLGKFTEKVKNIEKSITGKSKKDAGKSAGTDQRQDERSSVRDASNPFAAHPTDSSRCPSCGYIASGRSCGRCGSDLAPSGGRSSHSGVRSNNNKSNITAGNHGNSWSAEEERQLRERYDGGASIDDLSNMHGRTREAITHRLIKLGYRL